MTPRRVAALLSLLIVGVLVPLSGEAQRAPVILATTTSTQDSGLLDVLVPMLEKQTGEWYIESGQGMGGTLGIADDRSAYTITDRATFLAFQRRVRLPILVEGDRPLLNIYSVLEVNPANGPRVNTAGGKAFADFMVAPDTQRVIKTFGLEKFGSPLFVPVAGMKEAEVGDKR